MISGAGELYLPLGYNKLAHQLAKRIHLVAFFFYLNNNRQGRGSFGVVNVEIVLLQETP
ncbi:hypothetical protein M110_4622, partial [Bacteroides fragilis str. 3397 N3]